MNHIDLFSGIGGFSIAAQWVWGAEHNPVLFCEQDKFCQQILRKHWPNVPIVEDVNDLESIIAYAFSGMRDRRAEEPERETQRGTSSCRSDSELAPYATGKRSGEAREYIERSKERAARGGSEHTSGVDLLTGGPPCQPASHAGKRQGAADARWLWPQALAAVEAMQSRWVVFENPTGFLSLAGGLEFEAVCARLEGAGYWVESFVIPACAVGAPHRRDRVWIVANSIAERCGRGQDHEGQQEADRNGYSCATSKDASGGRRVTRSASASRQESGATFACNPIGDAPNSNQPRPSLREVQSEDGREEFAAPFGNPWDEHWYEAAARLCRVAHGLSRGMDGTGSISSEPKTQGKAAGRLHRLKALGNAIVPQVAAHIFEAIKQSDRSM